LYHTLRDDFSFSRFFRVFILKACWIFSKAFFYVLRWSCDYCPWLCLCFYMLIYLPMLTHICILRRKKYFIMIYAFFNVSLNWVHKYSIEAFLHIYQRNWSTVPSMCVLIQMWHQGSTHFIGWFTDYSFCFYFIESFWSVASSSSLKLWLKWEVNLSGHGLFFLFTDSLQLPVLLDLCHVNKWIFKKKTCGWSIQVVHCIWFTFSSSCV
jgi:hypothetical protein